MHESQDYAENQLALRRAALLRRRVERPEGMEHISATTFLIEIIEAASDLSEDARRQLDDYLDTVRYEAAIAIRDALGLTDEQFFGIMLKTHSVVLVS